MSEELQEIRDGVKTLLSKHGSVVKEINSIKTTVEVIKATCENRGNTCATTVTNIDGALRGTNNQNGLISRVKQLENTEKRGEKNYYIVFGAILAAVLSLGVTLLCTLFK